jgi:hypothetical protein
MPSRRWGAGFCGLGVPIASEQGACRHTPLAEIAPVQFDPIDPAKRKRLALLLIIDKSGSTADTVAGGLSRLDLGRRSRRPSRARFE